MTTCERFQIVVVPFPFVDAPVSKPRPALVLSSQSFNREHRQAILASDDRRPAYLAVGLVVVFFAIAQTGPVAAYCALVPLSPGMLLSVAAGLVVWTLLLREMWRRQWLDRFLGMEPAGPTA